MVAKQQADGARLSSDELAYHQTVIAQQRAAQAATASWMAHLSGKYQLPEGTQITEAGALVWPDMRLSAVLTGDDA